MSAILQEADSLRAVEIFKCLAEENRLRILHLLDERPLCVCHIEAILGIGPVRTSQQLAYLKRYGLVEVEIRGTWRVYSISPSAGPEFAAVLTSLRTSVFCAARFHADRARLLSGLSCP